MTARDFLPAYLTLTILAALILGVVFLAVATVPHFASETNLAAVNAAEVFSLTNEERDEEGVAMLQRNTLLDKAAQMKAQDMAAKGYYAHVSPEGLTPMHWVDEVGYKYLIIGENLVVNRTDAEQVVDAFMGSPGHRANILRKDFTEIGVGVANGVYKGKDATFTVQIFAAPYPRSSNTVSKSSKENVKQSSRKDKEISTPSTPKTQVLPNVPRETGSKSAGGSTSTPVKAVVETDSIQEKVKVLINPLVSSIATTTFTVGTTSTSTQLNVPSFSLNTSVPIELAGVSQLEAQTLPVPVGSTWTMELRAFLENVVLGAKNLFVI